MSFPNPTKETVNTTRDSTEDNDLELAQIALYKSRLLNSLLRSFSKHGGAWSPIQKQYSTEKFWEFFNAEVVRDREQRLDDESTSFRDFIEELKCSRIVSNSESHIEMFRQLTRLEQHHYAHMIRRSSKQTRIDRAAQDVRDHLQAENDRENLRNPEPEELRYEQSDDEEDDDRDNGFDYRNICRMRY
jgi:hypothetical protein